MQSRWYVFDSLIPPPDLPLPFGHDSRSMDVSMKVIVSCVTKGIPRVLVMVRNNNINLQNGVQIPFLKV